ncbi:hypothetical protein B5X24_HaOG200866 [Helicoverpa armigera]|nr:hypothetical protein B5X24_HaOG200866 [Helicoverpa armigera]
MNADLLKCFAPIHNVLLFLGSSRLKIKNNMIAPSTRYQKMYALCCIFIVTLSFSYIQLYYYLTYYHEDTTIYVCYAIGIMVQNVSYLSHTIFARFLDVESSVKLCQNLQKVDNILRLKQFKRYNEQQYYWNVVVLVFIITSFECGFLVHIWYTVEYPILAFFAGIGLLNVYMELVLAASLIVYLAIRLKFLNKIAHHNFKIKGYYNNTRAACAVDEHLLINSDVKDANIDLGNFLICMKEILKMYQHITQVFSFPVSRCTTRAKIIKVRASWRALSSRLLSF